MFNFFKSRSYLGIDIGTTSIKAVEIKKTPDGLELTNYGILESYGHLKRLNDSIQTSSLKISVQETALMVRNLVEKSGFKTKEVIASIPAFSAFTTFLELPDMPPAETQSAIKFQIPRYIPLAPEEMSIDWSKVDERVDEKGIKKQQILIIAVPNEKILKYQEIFKSAGLKLKFLEVESLSLIRGLTGNDEETTMILDIGSRSTNIVITVKGLLRYSIQTDYAGFSLTQAIANGLSIDTRRAEELKRSFGIGEAEKNVIQQAMSSLIDMMAFEAKKTIHNYEDLKKTKITRVVLVGGLANMPNFANYFGEKLGTSVTLGNPVGRVILPKELLGLQTELNSTFAISLGLGMREI